MQILMYQANKHRSVKKKNFDQKSVWM